MISKIDKEILRNKERNEIFYSLSQYHIQNIKRKILSSVHPEYLDVVIEFQSHEIDKIFKILSSTYILPNKEAVDIEIWETYICNRILEDMQSKEILKSDDRLTQEKNLLMSFKLDKYLEYSPKRTTVAHINEVSKTKVVKRVRIHYFPTEDMMPISLQKAMNHIFSESIYFSNMLYTSSGSLNCNYKGEGKWVRDVEEDFELWQASTRANEKLLF